LYWADKYTTSGKMTSSVAIFQLLFHRAAVWASLTLTPAELTPTGTRTSCDCFSPGGFAIREAHVGPVAKALLRLL